MKSGQIEYYIEIPIRVNYTAYPEEPMTLTYPGCSACIEVDEMKYPSQEEIGKLVDNETDGIEMACWEDLEEPNEEDNLHT